MTPSASLSPWLSEAQRALDGHDLADLDAALMKVFTPSAGWALVPIGIEELDGEPGRAARMFRVLRNVDDRWVFVAFDIPHTLVARASRGTLAEAWQKMSAGHRAACLEPALRTVHEDWPGYRVSARLRWTRTCEFASSADLLLYAAEDWHWFLMHEAVESSVTEQEIIAAVVGSDTFDDEQAFFGLAAAVWAGLRAEDRDAVRTLCALGAVPSSRLDEMVTCAQRPTMTAAVTSRTTATR